MKKDNTEWLGLCSGALTTFAFLPQIVAIWKMAPRPAPAVSLATYIVIAIGVAGWVVYGHLKHLIAVKVWNAITFVFVCAVLVYKLKYG